MSEQPPASRTPKGAIYALGLLMVINLFNYLDRTVLNALSLPIRGSIGLEKPAFGYLTSVFLYAYMLGAPLMGRLSERFSRWWIIAASVAVWSLASGMTGLATTFGMLLISRILVGIGEAGYGPAAPALISDYFPVERRGRVMALFYLAIPVGSALGYVYGGPFTKGVENWRWAFYLVVPPGLLLALLCLRQREPERVSTAPVEKRSLVRDTKTLLRIPSYVFNTLAMTAMTFAIGGISVWIPEYMTDRMAQQHGIYPFILLAQPWALEQRETMLQEVNTTFGIIVVISGIISTFLGGWVADKLRTRFGGAYMLVSGIAILVAFPCTLAMLKLPFPYTWAAVFGAVFFLFFNTGPANTALANVTSSNMRATAFALNIFTIHAFGDAFSPPLIGWLATKTTWNTAFLLVSLMMVLASALWLIGSRYLADDEERASMHQ
jgi:MFS transporter, Spinster family, sphingosine-1-phosphate transporter